MITFIVSIVTADGRRECREDMADSWFELYLKAEQQYGICKFSARPA